MSVPTNSSLAKARGCNPVSSNCVVWQGPDLQCIDLCKGDTISEVVAKMAEELCAIIDTFNLQDYDFSCLAIPTSEQPDALKDLIQILIDRICALEGIDNQGGAGASGCPENCVVPIAPCFQYTNEQGDLIENMGLLEYVAAIAVRVCSNVTSIENLDAGLLTAQEDIDALEALAADLTNTKVDQGELQYVNSTKIDPSGESKFVTDALRSVENSLIQTQDSLGSTTDMYKALLKEGNLKNEDQLASEAKMSAIADYKTTVENIGDSVNNLWLSVHDIRTAVKYIQDNLVIGCSDISLNFTAQLVGDVLTIYTTNSTGFTADWKECSTLGTVVSVVDSNDNKTSFRANLIDLISNPSGYSFDLAPTSVDTSLTLTITAESCFANDKLGVTCEKPYVYTIYSAGAVPAVTLTVYTDSINYQFNSTSGYSYVAKVYLAGAPTAFVEQVIATPGVIVLNSIPGLTADTDYEFELTAIDGKGNETIGAKQPFTTLPNNCTPPINAVVNLTI